MLCPFLLSSVVGWFPVIFKMRNIYKYIYISFFLVALGLSCGMRVFTVSCVILIAYICIYICFLVALGLGCGMQVFTVSCVTFVAAHGISSCGAWVQLP